MRRPERRRRACCLVSEFLEEAGLDRESGRRLVRQLLEGVILMCRWQLERMRTDDEAPPPSRARGARKISVA